MSTEQKHITVWNNCLRTIEQNIDSRPFNTWFKPIKAISLVDDTIRLEVPSDFVRQVIEDDYYDILTKALKREIGSGAKLLYTIRPVANQAAINTPGSPVARPSNHEISINTANPGDNPGAFIYPGLHQKIKPDPRLNPEYCFDNFIKGECNKLAVSAGANITKNPGTNPFNPLFVFGGSGLGKTHFAQAVGIAINSAYPDLVVQYVTGTEFKCQFVNATMQNKLNAFLAYYMKIDVLIIDDIQDMASKSTQSAFFSIFNFLHQNRKQLILTSDRAPVELQEFENRLQSRFKWGLHVELQRPDYKTRLEMLKMKRFREGVDISDEVLEYLAAHVTTNFRELTGAFISVLAYSVVDKSANPLDIAAKVTDNLVKQESHCITIDKVQDIVCEYFNISRDTLVSTTRKRQIVQARQIAMYLSRNYINNISLSTIGSEIGGKDHATVLHACNTVCDLMSTDRSFKKYVLDIENMLAPAADLN